MKRPLIVLPALLVLAVSVLPAARVSAAEWVGASEGVSAPPPPPVEVAPNAPVGAGETASEELESTFRAAPRAQTMDELTNSLSAELAIHNVRSRYTLNLFGDTSLGVGRPAAPDHHLGFALGAQNFLIKGELGKHMVALTEFAVESGAAGFGIDFERFNVRWQSGPVFIEAGRNHTAMGYWNNAYHHGRWLQLTIARPRWAAFEDDQGLLPVHWVGLTSGAKVKLSSGTLNLTAAVGNGRGKIVDDVRNTGDYQTLKAVYLSSEYVGLIWPDLRVGIAGILDRIPAQSALDRPTLPDQAINEIIGGAHVAYPSVPLLLIAESYLVVHRATGKQWSTYGGFVTVGYAIGQCTPYVQGERIASRGGQDPFFIPNLAAPDRPSFDSWAGVAGLRFDLSEWSALKAEYRHTRFLDSASTFQEAILNWSWGF